MSRNTLKIDTSGFSRILTEIEKLGGSVERITEKELKQAAVQIMNDTIGYTADAYLPAGGQFSSGDTRAAIIRWPKVEWEGTTAWVPVGFDFTLPGAGGFLITGTPRMEPDVALNKMYKNKSYMAKIQRKMQEDAWDEMISLMENG